MFQCYNCFNILSFVKLNFLCFELWVRKIALQVIVGAVTEVIMNVLASHVRELLRFLSIILKCIWSLYEIHSFHVQEWTEEDITDQSNVHKYPPKKDIVESDLHWLKIVFFVQSLNMSFKLIGNRLGKCKIFRQIQLNSWFTFLRVICMGQLGTTSKTEAIHSFND